MNTRIADYYRNVKWVKWIEIICFPILGLWLIIRGYSFLQDDLGKARGFFTWLQGHYGSFVPDLTCHYVI